MKISDTLLGFVIVALSITILIIAAGFPTLNNQSVGAGTFPSIIAWVMLTGGLLLVLGDLRSFRWSEAVEIAPWLKTRGALWRVACVPGFTIAYILLSKPIGFPLVVPVLLTGFLTLTTGRPGRSLLVALGATAAIWFLFAQVLKVPLPLGLLTEVIY